MNTSRIKPIKHIISLLILFVIAAIAPATLFAEGEIITRIEMEGERRIEEGAILANIESRVGDYFSREMLSEDIKRVFKMGYFNDIKVDVSGDKLRPVLTFIVTERPYIKEIRVEGNDKVKKRDS